MNYRLLQDTEYEYKMLAIIQANIEETRWSLVH